MEYKVLIISVYFFIAFIVAIAVYALNDSDHSNIHDMIFYAFSSLLIGTIWGAFIFLLPFYLIFKFIDKYVRN